MTMKQASLVLFITLCYMLSQPTIIRYDSFAEYLKEKVDIEKDGDQTSFLSPFHDFVLHAESAYYC